MLEVVQRLGSSATLEVIQRLGSSATRWDKQDGKSAILTPMRELYLYKRYNDM